jgi:hypothetical protein
MLRLAKTELPVLTQQRVIRMQLDMRMLRTMSAPEIRAVYSELEWVRDELSRLLDHANDKQV